MKNLDLGITTRVDQDCGPLCEILIRIDKEQLLSVMFVILHILSLLDVLLLDVANEPQLTNKQTWDNTISNSAGQYSCKLQCIWSMQPKLSLQLAMLVASDSSYMQWTFSLGFCLLSYLYSQWVLYYVTRRVKGRWGMGCVSPNTILWLFPGVQNTSAQCTNTHTNTKKILSLIPEWRDIVRVQN